MSAPWSSGRWKTGPSRVLSQTMIGRRPWRAPISSAIRRSSAMSTSVLVGLAGVSIRMTDTRPLPSRASAAAARTAASSTPSAKPDRADAEVDERARQQRLGAAIERLRMQDDVAGPGEGEQRRGDRRHAGGEQHALLGALVDGEPVLDDLAVGMVEARIDEAGAGACRRLAAAGDVVEEVAPSSADLNTKVEVRNTGGLTAPSDSLRIVAVAQHQRLGMERVIADMGLGGRGATMAFLLSAVPVAQDSPRRRRPLSIGNSRRYSDRGTGGERAVPQLIAVDWGTSSLRGARLDEAGRVLEEKSAPLGILNVPNGDFAGVFASLFSDWMKPAGSVCLISGMAGSRQGWVEAPYCRLSRRARRTGQRLHWIEPGRIAIVPGLSDEQGGRARRDARRGGADLRRDAARRPRARGCSSCPARTANGPRCEAAASPAFAPS